MKAVLIYSNKLTIKNRYKMQLTIHAVDDKKNYPDGIKYGLICIDSKTNKKVLLDNHHPKGPHAHIDEVEFPYPFVDEETLIEDFKQMVFDHLEIKI